MRERNSAKYKPPGNLIEAIANAAVERGSQGGQSNGDSIGRYPVLPMNNTRLAANCCDITKARAAENAAKAAKPAKQNKSASIEYSESSEAAKAEYKWLMLQQVLQPAAYPEHELRRIVCWLLILSAEI